ncbi:efflux RND transporter periplasmic adaptor subunit [Candidatus Uabimicrobium amorphum]|uniref:Secretion protein HlyD n=1 Tax=Uabimicrobium amorphum TaxID=2596890 RepID=A0A5S9F7K4_UABAM|nr:efflux RND transporter periplasmic adaptor subunit [Candidatus Uabimicrobium amorphum]BBM87819.1 secretion protein HlyD [Candidatus Uabimicrobium amorphum]
MRYILLCMLLFIGCNPSATKPKKRKKPPTSVSLKEHVTTLRKIVEKYETTGELVSVRQATLSAEVSGQIISRPIYVGDAVKKNQLLLSLEKELLAIEKKRLQQNIILEKARAYEAKSNLVRQQKLGIATTPQQLEKATTNYTIVQQNLAILQQNLRKVSVNISKTDIRAPFSGEISKVFVQENEFAQVSQPLVTITDRSTLKIVTGVPENVITKLSKKSEVQILIPSVERKYRSTVFCTYPVMNSNTKKIPVEIRIVNNNNFLYSGMFCRLYFRVGITKGIVVPFNFVKVAYDMYFVKVMQEQKFIEKRVAATLHKDGWLIMRGIKVGQKIQEY